MKNKDIGLILFVVFLVCAGVVLICVGLVEQNRVAPRTCYYEWEDALGNYGTATQCTQTREGNLICRTEDTRRQVINYNHICE